MARMFNIAVVFVAAAMYMAFAAPGPQGGQVPPLTPPAGAGIPEGANNNYTGPPPNNCTQFVEKCNKFETNEQVIAGSSQLGNVPGVGSAYAEVNKNKYDCTKLAVTCNGTAPTPPANVPNPAQTPGAPNPGGQTPPATGTFLL